MIYNQDDDTLSEDIIRKIDFHYSGNMKAWVQSGGKIEYPKNIKFQVHTVLYNWKKVQFQYLVQKNIFAISKMTKKINFCTRKKFKTTTNAIFGLKKQDFW